MANDKLVKLVNKLGFIDEKIGFLRKERSDISEEILKYLDLNDTIDTTKSAKKSRATTTKTPLGSQIVAYLATNPGVTLVQIAKAIKASPSQVGLSIYHLSKKAEIFEDGDRYYAPVEAAAAARTTTADES